MIACFFSLKIICTYLLHSLEFFKVPSEKKTWIKYSLRQIKSIPRHFEPMQWKYGRIESTRGNSWLEHVSELTCSLRNDITSQSINKRLTCIPYLCAFYPPWSLPRPGILPEFQFRFVTLTRPDILPAYWNLTRIIISDSLIKYFNLNCCNVLMG